VVEYEALLFSNGSDFPHGIAAIKPDKIFAARHWVVVAFARPE